MSSPRKGPPRGRAVFWTPERVAQIIDLAERGWSDERIAATLGKTKNAVTLARQRYRIAPGSRQAWTAKAVARLLGESPKVVARWIREGHLRATPGAARGPHRQLMVTHASLLRFLEDPAHWHRWEPERVTRESGIASWARSIRAGVRFLTVEAVAARCYVEHKTVLRWITSGRLAAAQDGWRWYVRADTLDAFSAPSQQSRAGRVPRRGWTPEEDALLLAMRAQGKSYRQVGAAVGRSGGAAYVRHGRLSGLPRAQDRSRDTLAERLWSRVEHVGECWRWRESPKQQPYGRLVFRGKPYMAHRAAWEVTYGPIPEGLTVRQRCGDTRCVNPAHLVLGPRRCRPLPPPGPPANRKLTVDDVRAIRAAYAAGGVSQAALGRRYGVYQSTVRMIVNGRNWRHVPLAEPLEQAADD